MGKIKRIIALASIAAALQWTASVAGDITGISGAFSLSGEVGLQQFLDGRLPAGAVLGAGISDAMAAVMRLSCLATVFRAEKTPQGNGARDQHRPAEKGSGAISPRDAARLSFSLMPFQHTPVSCAVPAIPLPDIPPGSPGAGVSLFILFLCRGGLRCLARGFPCPAVSSVLLRPADELHPAGFFILGIFCQRMVRA